MTKTAQTSLEPTVELSSFGVDLAEAARLGARAEGAEVVMITPPAGYPGVPIQVPAVILRGEHPKVVDLHDVLDAYRTHPARKSGTAQAQTLDSFCELVNRHKTGNSAVFADADWRKPSFTAVIDYHHVGEAGQPDNGRHRVHYAFPLSEEWKAWMEHNGKPMSQKDFAEFLEDRIPELSSPTEEERIRFERDFATTLATPSQLVELSRGLQVNVASKVKQAHTLSSGEGQIIWEESHQDADGKPLKVPGIFILSIAPFFMGEAVRMPVRLRYRTVGGGVTWFYQVYRPDQFITEHVRATMFVTRDRTELPVFEGKPEMSA